MSVALDGDDGVRKHPLDFDVLKKGDVITIEKMEEIFSLSRKDEDFCFKRMGLRNKIIDELDVRGYIVTVVFDHDALRILTDEEASDYNDRRFQKGIKVMFQAHRRNLGVDRGNLSEDKKKVHDRNLEVNGGTLSATLEKRQELRFLPQKRKTPLIPEDKKKDDDQSNGGERTGTD